MDHSALHCPSNTFTLCSHPFVGGPQLTDVCSESSGILFLTLLNSLLIANPKIGDPCGRITPIKEPKPSYDFIIVGAGAGGAVVARRLSEIQKWNVLLVEAGPDEPAGVEIPANMGLYTGTKLDWNYKTSNESYACLASNKRCTSPRGKSLGGTTILHGMMYHRGNRKNYERWVAMGNKGWSWEDVFPYYLKSENNTEIGRVSAKYHGDKGPMVVQRFPYQPPFAWTILKAAEEAGFGTSEDLVGDKITGFAVTQTMSDNGVRVSSVGSFVRPVARRTNLHVATEARVTKIITIGKQVKGIEMLMNGKKYTINATKEVVLSAGTLNTPQLLLLSGIGPKEELRSKNIPVVMDLPGVGENYHNHQSYGINFTLNDPCESEFDLSNAEEYLEDQRGPFSCTGLAQVTALLASNLTTPDDPDIQIFCAGYSASCTREGTTARCDDGKRIVNFASVNVQPRSRGRVTLNTTNPLDAPYIWSNDLSNEEDVSIVIQGIHMIMKLANTTTMRKLGLTPMYEKIPQCADFKEGTDDYWKCFMHWKSRPENHQSGTAKMGPPSDRMAVVDTRLKVYGIEGLRIADASVVPQVVSGNPTASYIMVGERASDFIKEDWGVLKSQN